MLLVYQILLIVIVVLFGLLAMGADDDKMKERCAKICGLGIVSLLVTFWLI